MKKYFFCFGFFLYSLTSLAQPTQIHKEDAWKALYRAFPTLYNDLKHTKLEAHFDYEKSQLIGKVWLNLSPHFYSTDSLILDAKGMDIKSISLFSNNKYTPLSYSYDSAQLNIKLGKLYARNENYTITIDYIARPNDWKSVGSAAINDAKGLYFINPKGAIKDKPTQIWTQGETEATSVWMPTIDKPNQKSTTEFFLTVPSKYISLSNGKLVEQKNNANGTRTDYWKMDLPHAPYLFFIGVGDYAVIKDSYKGKEVNYYVEKPYASVAKKIFGNTPEMMKFFSEKVTGVEYPWNKFSQITARDYVSGAMENTTATLYQEGIQQDARELVDGNTWEGTIAHELFHHWFGDYVTTESWSNLTVNESFANYAQLLWQEYKYGKDAAGAENFKEMSGYLMSNSEEKDLVRYYYRDKEDMFDAVSYNKGGRILHMLRYLVGDEAFYKSLNLYLTTNKFGTGSAAKLRIAFETVTGKDWNWFWNQWYYGSGHPKLKISTNYFPESKQTSLVIEQTQDTNRTFILPITVDVYTDTLAKRYTIQLNNSQETFYFPAETKPFLINLDADKVLLVEKTEGKNIDEYLFQYRYAKNYLDRKEALEFAKKQKSNSKTKELIALGLDDPFYQLKILSINSLKKDQLSEAAILQKLESIATTDKKSLARAAAIDVLGKTKNIIYKPIYLKAVYDSSYTVAGNALKALSKIDTSTAVALAFKFYKAPAKGQLAAAIIEVIEQNSTDVEMVLEVMLNFYDKQEISEAKFGATYQLSNLLKKTTNIELFKKGVDAIITFKNAIPANYQAQTNPFFIEQILKPIKTEKEKSGDKEKADYINFENMQR